MLGTEDPFHCVLNATFSTLSIRRTFPSAWSSTISRASQSLQQTMSKFMNNTSNVRYALCYMMNDLNSMDSAQEGKVSKYDTTLGLPSN